MSTKMLGLHSRITAQTQTAPVRPSRSRWRHHRAPPSAVTAPSGSWKLLGSAGGSPRYRISPYRRRSCPRRHRHRDGQRQGPDSGPGSPGNVPISAIRRSPTAGTFTRRADGSLGATAKPMALRLHPALTVSGANSANIAATPSTAAAISKAAAYEVVSTRNPTATGPVTVPTSPAI